MVKFAITGNIACGKSVALEVIKSFGYQAIDCDDIVKDLYKNYDFIQEIKKEFPEIVFNECINLKLLREKLFNNKEFKQSYEKFIFPEIKTQILEYFKKNTDKKFVFVVVPLLFEAGFENLFDKIVFISSEEKTRKSRLISRKSMLSDIAEIVISSQQKEETKIPKCDYVIKNNGTLEEFKNAVNKFLNNII